MAHLPYFSSVPVGGSVPSGPYTARNSPLPLSSIDSADCGRGPYFDWIKKVAICAVENSAGGFVKSLTSLSPAYLTVTDTANDGNLSIEFTAGSSTAQYPFEYTPGVNRIDPAATVPSDASFLIGPGGGTGSPSMWFHGPTGALRIGTSYGAEWAGSFVGTGSFAAGDNNQVIGNSSGAFGDNNFLDVRRTLVVGQSNTIGAGTGSGKNSGIFGHNHLFTSNIDNSLIVGEHIQPSGPPGHVTGGSIVAGSTGYTMFNSVEKSFVYIGGANISSPSTGIKSSVALFGGDYDVDNPRTVLFARDALSASFRNGFTLSSGPQSWNTPSPQAMSNGLGAMVHMQPLWFHVEAGDGVTGSSVVYTMPEMRLASVIHVRGTIIVVSSVASNFGVYRCVATVEDVIVARDMSGIYTVDNQITASYLTMTPPGSQGPGFTVTANGATDHTLTITNNATIPVVAGVFLTFIHVQSSNGTSLPIVI